MKVEYNPVLLYPLQITDVMHMCGLLEDAYVLLSEDEILELYNQLITIAADIIQRRANEKK